MREREREREISEATKGHFSLLLRKKVTFEDISTTENQRKPFLVQAFKIRALCSKFIYFSIIIFL